MTRGTQNKNKKGMELTFSTIATLIAIFAVLLVVLMFFQGGFREIGTGKFKTFADESTPTPQIKIDKLIGNIGGWFGSTCTGHNDCAGEAKCGFVCKSTTPKGALQNPDSNDCYYEEANQLIPGKNVYETHGNCLGSCADACGSPECYETKRCVG